ncbi:uncharacterized protein RJT20DRAFT_96297 [Scheffersomyces xylosifermentans]|uniref:uncharacterized protein n=1 Tax=Scheffersomyces xylosifermentans TaxID=1304137 RepID=UPI00315D8B5C
MNSLNNNTGALSLDAANNTSKNQSLSPENEPRRSNKSASKKRKKKVEIACVYCRRSHMICDETRPCQRCIKRGIGHLCYDEPSNNRQRKKAASLRKPNSGETSGENTPVQSSSFTGGIFNSNANVNGLNNFGPRKSLSSSVLAQTLPYNQEPFFYSEHAGSEFSSLNDFLSMIDDPELVNGALNDDAAGTDSMMSFGVNTGNVGGNGTNNAGLSTFGESQTNSNSQTNLNNILSFSPNANLFPTAFQNESDNQQFQQQQEQQQQVQQQQQQQQLQLQQQTLQNQQLQQNAHINNNGNNANKDHQPVISDSARDKFFLTAADPTTEISPEERLKQVIKAKLEAGLLQPYNYAKGYARLQSYMDNYMNISSRQRILKPLSIFRPAFRAIARTLKDVDLVLVEESFERMLLDYDRVFTSMAIPACLWRRTGEIYRGNKEFASLVGVMTDDLKDGKLAIYELMSEESAVNFWEKYGAIAFDKGQKAVLTSCNLRTRDGIKRKSCCFSFTIRRDRYNIPSCIVGNFIPIDP